MQTHKNILLAALSGVATLMLTSAGAMADAPADPVALASDDTIDSYLKPILVKIPEESIPYVREAAVQRSDKAAEMLRSTGSLIPNGDLEADRDGNGKPDHWNDRFAIEEGNTFLRLKVENPKHTDVISEELVIPFGVGALELSFDWRVSDLKVGSKPWEDARVLMKFKDAARTTIQSTPPVYTRNSTNGWESRSSRFLVPEGTVWMEFMPALLNVRQGTLDMDNLVLKPIPADELIARKALKAAEKARLTVAPESASRADWPAPLRVVGNRLQDPDGKEVWLQGVAIPSMEWNPHGENMLKSVQVAIEVWEANVIRLPVKGAYWLGEGGADYRKLIRDIVTYAANRGAYTVLDLHHYRAARQEDAEFWQEAATEFKNHPAVLFDLINEPHGTSWEVWRNGGYVSEKKGNADEDTFLSEEEKIQNNQGFRAIGMQALLDTVRETGAENVVVVGGLDWAYDLSGILDGYALDEHPNGRGIMYSTHVYPWKKGWRKSFLDAAEHYPLLLGEVGADENKMNFMPHEIQEDADTWVPAILGVIQKYKLNWTGWAFHPKAAPRLLLDWKYTPTPFWGVPAKAALSGVGFEFKGIR